jgi:hypothetical protein
VEQRDPVTYVAAGVVLVVAVAVILYAIFLTLVPAPAAPSTDLSELERQLANARSACVAGPPQGPACVEVARLSEDIAKRKSRR